MNRWIESSDTVLRKAAVSTLMKTLFRISPVDETRDHLNVVLFKWLGEVEVAPQRPLMHELGVSHSMNGPQLRARFLHAAGEDVEVVGVHVNSAEEFRRMDPAQLLGPQPHDGVEAAAVH
jgi:hypothetical protein